MFNIKKLYKDSGMITWYTDEEKRRILKKSMKLKVERSGESEAEIANKLGVSRSSIALWKKELWLGKECFHHLGCPFQPIGC